MKYIVIIYIFLYSFICFGMKGRLLLVGGGSEQTGGWSNASYQWGVDHAANKKVAIISYASGASNYLSNYFTSSLGAVKAKDFTFSTTAIADLSSTYDTLMQYDMVFFRGGDQSKYYGLFKGTKLAKAIQDKYESGGVIAGTSAGLHVLSSIVFTAEYESLDALSAIQNITSSSYTLRNNLFNLFPNYVFDSHVAERGRFPRTLSFMANYFIAKGKKINAIAVDDLTAMGIDTNDIGTAFGTGAVGIYKITSTKNNPFIIAGKNPLSDFVSVCHLLNGWKYNFKTQEIIGYKSDTATIKPVIISNVATTLSSILLSGDDLPASNTRLIRQLTDSSGLVTDTIIIITPSNAINNSGLVFSTTITGNTQAKTFIFYTNSQLPGDTSLRPMLARSKKILFTGNPSDLIAYIYTDTAYGKIIQSITRKKDVTVAFAGKTSALAGKSVVSANYLTDGDAAYYARLTTSRGLHIIPGSLILPYAFTSASGNGYFENQTSAVPYFMMKDTCKIGIMLHSDMVVRYGFIDSKRNIKAYGDIPTIIYSCDSTKRAFSSTTSKNTGSPRQVAGFSQMKIAFLGNLNSYFVNESIAYEDTLLYVRVPDNEEVITTTPGISTTIGFLNYYENNNTIITYPNPTHDYINMNETNIFSYSKISLIDFNGKLVYESFDTVKQIPVGGLPAGIYSIIIQNDDQIYSNKVVIGELCGE